MTSNEFNKRILIIGLSFNDTIGAGVTLRHLFSQIQPNRLGIIDYCVTSIDFEYAKSLFNISLDKEVTGSESNALKNRNKEVMLDIFKLSFLSLRKYLSYYYNNFFYINITSGLKRFIADFDPDYLYLVPYNYRVVNLALRISQEYKISIVTHFMDDFRKRSPLDIFYYFNEYLTKKRIKHLVEDSWKCLAICDYMGEEYQSIFKRTFHSFHNPIQTHSFQKHSVISYENNLSELKIAYTGTIAENNFDTLIKFSDICERTSAYKTKIYFDIYSPNNTSNIFYQRFVKAIGTFHHTKLKGSFSHNEIIPKLYEYNLLFLPLSFRKKYHSVIEFSFPTKVAEYMASGIPTLYIIPKDIALHHYLKKHKTGYLIDELNSKHIEDFLLSFIKDPNMRKEDLRAREIAYNNFNIVDVASNFEKIFS